MHDKYWIFFFILIGLAACKPDCTPVFVEVPTVTKNALSGVNTGSPKNPLTRLYAEYAGKGDTLILIHGYGVDRRMWDGSFRQFAKRFYVIRYDLRGYGKSDMPEEGFGYLHADDLRALMDAMHIHKAHLVGVSLGGKVVAEFVALYPERVLSATLSSGALSHIPDRTSVPSNIIKVYNDTVFAYNVRNVRRNDSIGIPSLKRDWKKAMKQISGKHYSHIKKDLNAMIDDWSGWQWTHPEVDAFIGDQADSLLCRQHTHPPILLLVSQYDFPDNKKTMLRMGAICPTARIQMLENVGHFSVMEDPSLFCKRVFKFIEETRFSNRKAH